jgi:abhydrolase domain-containing protein 12
MALEEKLAVTIQHHDKSEAGDRQNKYDITVIHAEDEYDILTVHSDVLFWHAVNTTVDSTCSFTFDSLGEKKVDERVPFGADGWDIEWRGKSDVIREQIVNYGLHDRIMSYPGVSLAVARAFQSQD